MVDRKEANLKMLNDTADIQNKTKESIFRIQKQTAEAEELGAKTLEELRQQGKQMVCIYRFILKCMDLVNYEFILLFFIIG